jgi:hypothetical protein
MSIKNMNIKIETSIADVFDRLSILEIKEEKIANEDKLIQIKNEKSSILDELKKYRNETIDFHYSTLVIVNRKIWELLDLAKYKSNNEKEELKYYREQEDYNERRFRIKRKIDNILNSNIKEQKGYKLKKCFILSHLGLGDHGHNIGVIRYLSTKYDESIVVCKNSNLKNMELFFKDDKDIKFHTCDTDANISPNYGFPIEEFRKVTEGMDLYLCGTHKFFKHVPYDYPFCYFDQLKLPYEIYWDYGYYPKTEISHKVNEILKGTKYVFIHNTCSYGQVFEVSKVEEKLNLNRDEIIFISPCVNIYPENHKFNNLAEKILDYRLSDYITTIENAEYVILSDSSFFGLAVQLKIKTEKCYYYSRDLDYDHLYKKYKYKDSLQKRKFIDINKI